MRPFSLAEFVTESNRIEGIEVTMQAEVDAHVKFLAAKPTIESLEALVDALAGAKLRRHQGMDVIVGDHRPPCGGARIVEDLKMILSADDRDAYEIHQQYETLHPFMDGNGRSGRALWLYHMGGIRKVPLGFLHTWYYQSLQTWRDPRRTR